MKMARWFINVTNAQKLAGAVSTLREFLDEPVVSKRDLAGVLQGFSFSFELAWKALQDETLRRGYLQKGPRPVLQAAFESGIISPESSEIWANMMEDRSLVAHTYRTEWATQLVDRIRGTHLAALESVSQSLNN